MNLPELMFLPILIGIGHSLEADHLVAVGNLVSIKSNYAAQSLKGAFWGLGHTVSVMLAAATLSFLRGLLGNEAHWPFEILVGIMLLLIGIFKIYKIVGANAPQDKEASKVAFFQVGLVHGLAGSGAVAALLSGHVGQPSEQWLFLTCFGLGTMLGMAAMAAAITQLGSFKRSWAHAYSLVLASISVIYGLVILYQQTLKPFIS
jgi:nickel/cobalt transporter (NicO) family protein